MVKFILFLTIILLSACAEIKNSEKYKIREGKNVVCNQCIEDRKHVETINCTRCTCCSDSEDLCCCLHSDKCTCNPSVCGSKK